MESKQNTEELQQIINKYKNKISEIMYKEDFAFDNEVYYYQIFNLFSNCLDEAYTTKEGKDIIFNSFLPNFNKIATIEDITLGQPAIIENIFDNFLKNRKNINLSKIEPLGE